MKNGFVCAVGLGGQSVFLNVDHFHAPGETLHAADIYSEPGGKAYNQIVAAARLGAEARFIGAMGDDENGRICMDFLKKEGIVPHIQICGDMGTAYACILTDAHGENRVTVYGGAANSLSAEYIRSCRDMLSRCAVLLLGYECPLDATLAALELAKELNIFTILNPAPAKETDIELLKSFDLITPNAQEAAVLLKTDSADIDALCACLGEKGIERAIVTLGSEGALVWENGRGKHMSAVRCESVDTTGAGDCFNGALAAALLRGDSLGKAAEFAIKASALSVTRPHVMTALPYLSEILM